MRPESRLLPTQLPALAALAALLLLAGSGVGVGTSATAASPKAVPFIEDDYSRALGEARAKDVPLFVESWAPW